MGCATQQDREWQAWLRGFNEKERQEVYRESLDRQCASIGFAVGSDAFRNCVLQLHQQNRAEAAQTQGILLNNAIQQQPIPPCLDNALGAYQRSQGSCR